MARRYEIEGMRELERTIRRIGTFPQKCATTAARKGARIALKDAKKNAPIDEGDLKHGIVLKGERSRVRGKKIYQVTFNVAMNDVFVKLSKAGKRSYYPASQEFGFFAKNGRYIPGYHFMREALDNNKREIETTMVRVMTEEIDKLR